VAFILKCLAQQKLFRISELENQFLRWRWFIIAAIVGTLLNLINQWEALMGTAAPDEQKLIMTYVVPYLVSRL
jgi:hypothetical protein